MEPRTVRLIEQGDEQILILPADIRLDCEEVTLRWRGATLILTPAPSESASAEFDGD